MRFNGLRVFLLFVAIIPWFFIYCRIAKEIVLWKPITMELGQILILAIIVAWDGVFHQNQREQRRKDNDKR